MTIQFLTMDDALFLHAETIRRSGGAHGVRDHDLLLSALAQPSAMFDGQYLHPTLSEMAAAYLYHVVQNHPFIDGNKRAGLLCTHAFLSLNQGKLDEKKKPSEAVLYDLVIGIASGKLTKHDAAIALNTWYTFLGM